MTESDQKPAIPPTIPIPGVNVPDPTIGSEAEGSDPVAEAQKKPDDPDKAAQDGQA